MSVAAAQGEEQNESKSGWRVRALPHLVRKVLESIFQPRRRVFLRSLKELVRQGGDERLKEVHGAEYLLGFGCVLGRVVDALVGSAETMAMGEKKRIKSDLKVFLELKTSNQAETKGLILKV